MNEISILRGLRHPQVIHLHEVYEQTDAVHLIFEFVRGGDLSTKLRHKGRFTEHEAAIIMHSLLETVAYCHDRGVIHRDIKPSNIILRYYMIIGHTAISAVNPGRVKLIDFGLGIRASTFLKGTPLCGSPGYIAPELFDQTELGTKADIYSCGIVLYYMYARFHNTLD